MSHAENQTGDLSGPADDPLVRWRAWPCESCRGSATALGFLVGSFGSIPEIPHRDRFCQIEWQQKWEAARLREWIDGCPHTQWTDLILPKIGLGSEHLVLFDEKAIEVVKVTLPGTYGDYYEISDNRVTQFCCTPAEYLLRLRFWQKLFSTAPVPLGLTESGQFVSRQRFITGVLPTQKEVDQFLVGAGAVAVRQNCWLWKKVVPEAALEIWIGDARSDNFVSAPCGIVPIDIRIWGVPIKANLSNP